MGGVTLIGDRIKVECFYFSFVVILCIRESGLETGKSGEDLGV